MKNRIEYFDTYRFFAAIMVFFTHYLGRFTENTTRFYNTMPYSILTKGISGKLGVSMLCVILGYFAYRKGHTSKENLLGIILKRYIYFVVICLSYYLIAALLHGLEMEGNIGELFKNCIIGSFTLTKEYNSLFWTLRPMLLGSIVCYILGRTNAKTIPVLGTLLILLILKSEWIFNCTIGSLLFLWENNETLKKYLQKIWVQLPLFLIPFYLIRGSESFFVYLMDGLFCFSLLLLTLVNDPLKKIMNARFWHIMNRSYFGIYIFHYLLYDKFGWTLLNMKGLIRIPYMIRLTLVFLFFIAVIVILSYPLDYLTRLLCQQIYKPIDSIEKTLNKSQVH